MPTLGYWRTRGLAQPIRLLLNYVGQEFNDVKYERGEAPDYSTHEWSSVKFTLGLPFPNIPYFIDGDIKISQSNAILRYIGRKHDLLGKTDQEKVAVDILLDQAMDFRNGVIRLCYNDKYEELKGDYFKQLPQTLDLFESFMGDKQWFAADQITVPDFPMYELLDQHRLMQPGCLESHKKITAFLERVEALPAIKTYMESDKFMKSPINNKTAAFIG